MTTARLRTWAAACLVISAGSSSLKAAEVPKYAPRPGQVLTYEENQTFKGKGENSAYRTTWRIWVVGKNDDGSFRMIVREAIKSLGEGGASGNADEMVSLARIDLYPDGTVPRTPLLGTRFDPSHLFPRLPGNDKECTSGWKAHDDRDDATTQYEPIACKEKDDGATVDFVADQSTFMEKIYEGKDRRTFHFDRGKGLVVRAEIEREFGSHMNSKGTGTLELKSIEELEPGKLATFRDDMNRAFETIEAYRKLYRHSPKSGGEAEQLLNKARSVLADARGKLTVAEAVAAIDDQLKNHNQFAKYQVDEAKRFAEIIGHAAPSWEVKDLEGKTHALEQYRGKVLVLDFWYRGCGWCMRAMPQVKEVERHYRGRPVAVFGMNNDRKEEDARFVVEKMSLEYPVLRSDELPGKYGVKGFPTLIVIDQQGKVADVHIGYSDHLFEDVTATVDRLLGAK
jgi:thiol-disulfide isomerase/thioredoxin